MTTKDTPAESAESQRDRNGHLWLQSMQQDLTASERAAITGQIDDALVLLASVGYHAAHVHLQTVCAAHDLRDLRPRDAAERWDCIQDESEIALQAAIDLRTLLYETADSGGAAGTDMFPEIHKATRQLLTMADDAAATLGNPLDLNGLLLNSQRKLPKTALLLTPALPGTQQQETAA